MAFANAFVEMKELFMKFYTDAVGQDFVVTNFVDLDVLGLSEAGGSDGEDFFYIFGYCFTEKEIIKNSRISESQFAYIVENKSVLTGIFVAVSRVKGKIAIVVDPLVQYNLFYHVDRGWVTISNSLTAIRDIHSLGSCDYRYLFDSLSYQSPLRGLTILEHVYAVQYDDMFDSQGTETYKPRLPLEMENFYFEVPDNDVYSSLSYQDLLEKYIEGLNSRAKLVSEKFEEVHVQLTGGADSRLVLSSLLDYDNVFTLCFGDGRSQNRLYSEKISKILNVPVASEMIFNGRGLSNSSLIFRALKVSNCRKFNNLDTYMNSDSFVNENKCQLTGYYGANISGGVVLPPEDTDKNGRISKIPTSQFTYHAYVELMKKRHGKFRRAAFNDIFYINNRGPSHYASHSIASNLRCNSFDILYDPLNIELVRKCPYSDSDVDRNAISVDLIHINRPDIALFPYDGRKIPRYRSFDDVPLVNCFEGLNLADEDISSIETKQHNVTVEDFDILNKGAENIPVSDMLGSEEVRWIFERYPFLEAMKDDETWAPTIILFYAYSAILMSRTPVLTATESGSEQSSNQPALRAV